MHGYYSSRSIASVNTGCYVQAVLDANVLATFTSLLQHAKPAIQKEAAWTISNITAGNSSQIQQVIHQNLLPLIIQILVKVNGWTVFLYYY